MSDHERTPRSRTRRRDRSSGSGARCRSRTRAPLTPGRSSRGRSRTPSPRRRGSRRSRGARDRSRAPPVRPYFGLLTAALSSILARVAALESSNSAHCSRDANGPVHRGSPTLSGTSVRVSGPNSDRSHVVPSVAGESVQRSSGDSPSFLLANIPVRPDVPQNNVETNQSECEVNKPVFSQLPSSSSMPVSHGPPCENSASISAPAHDLIEAIKSLQPARSQNCFVSNFDPTIHDIDDWCKEVEGAEFSNGWSDYECLSRVASCLKGDAKAWLHNWVSDDRSWHDFVLEFKPLCPRRLDYANILYEAMTTNSDKYPTYAEYARRALLRLRMVKGLSDELMTMIVIRGIADPQIRAAASNAKLTCGDLVSFLSIYVRPSRPKQDIRTAVAGERPFPAQGDRKCFVCGESGHKGFYCPREPKGRTNSEASTGTQSGDTGRCAFCRRPGHTEQTCFAGNRSEPRNKREVDLCTERAQGEARNGDIAAAVIQGVPVDVLIDSGALNVSLVSADVLKHFSYTLKPVDCAIGGIGGRDVVAGHSVTLTVEFGEISIEADFVVVPADCVGTPIIIGTDVLDRDGVTYIRTKDRQCLARSPSVSKHLGTVATRRPEVTTSLKGDEYKSLTAVLDEYSDCLIIGTANTTVKTGRMHIKLTDHTPIAYRPYKLSHQERLRVREIIKDLKDRGIVRESTSRCSSPIILVRRRGGSDGVCVDCRALNGLTVRERCPLPLMDDHMDRLGKFRYFTSLDMAAGFHRIPIGEGSMRRTGFVTPEGHCGFVGMPFGLASSPMVYQRIVDGALRSFIGAGGVLVYMDDVLLLSSSIQEGVDLLRRVLETLTGAGFSINIRRCSFLATEVEYLGGLVAVGRVRPSPRKVEALVGAPPPSSVGRVGQFLGLAGCFGRCIQGCATGTACMARLLKKDVPFFWGPEQERVRQEMVTHLATEPILAIFDPELSTEVRTDAGSIGYGAVLMRTHRDGEKRVVACFSESAQAAESGYHSYELETLAVVEALQNFRHYLIGIKFKLVTDCNALGATEKKKDLLPRVARWWVCLRDFSFGIECGKGTMMSRADYLSRNPIADVNVIARPRNWAQVAQAAGEETQKLIQRLQDGQLDPARYCCENDTLFCRCAPVGEDAGLLCCVPKGHRLGLLRVFHDEHEHVGSDGTSDLILKHFWFPGLRRFVAEYIRHCLVCVSMKRVPGAPRQPVTSWPEPELPFEAIHVDALGPLPMSNDYGFVLLVIDAFSKCCLLCPMKRQDADELVKALSNTISLFGVPKLLVADRGRMFGAHRFVKWIKDQGCDVHCMAPEMRHSSGQVERYIRTALNMIRIGANRGNMSWSDTLWRLQLVLNITRQRTAQSSPMNLLVGINGTTPVIRNLIRDLAMDDSSPNRAAWRELCRSRASELLERNREERDRRVNEGRRPARVFQVGDFVFAIKYSQSTGKLDPGMRGPYRIIKALPSGRYELRLLTGSYGRTTQAAAEFLVLWRGEWCPESCAAFFENDDIEDSDAGPSQAPRSITPTPSTGTVAPSALPQVTEDIDSGEETESAEDFRV